jgi:hypothetical protein
MLTAQQAIKIVRDCIREVTRPVIRIRAGQRLQDYGIDSGARLKRFKLMIVKHVRRRQHEIATSDLDFDQNVVLATIYRLIVADSVSLMKRDGEEPPQLPNLPKRKSSDDIAWWRVGKDKAKKKTAKEKSKARGRSGNGSSAKIGYRGVAGALGDAPSKRSGGKKETWPRGLAVISHSLAEGE